MAGRRDAPALWKPHPGPQVRFLSAREFEALYGGAAGGGKSDALLFGGLRQIRFPNYRAVFLRQSFPELRDVMDRAHNLFPRLSGQWNEQQKRWRFPAGSTFEFGYCQTYTDVQRYQGQEFDYIGFDEIGNIGDERVWTFLMSRCRSKDAAIVPLMRCSANPGGAGHAWLKRRFVDATDSGKRAYVDRATGLSRAFIPARVTDNPTLLSNNPQYVSQLRALPEMLRRQFLDGDWSAGSGLALEELDRRVHMMRAFDVPDRWAQFGAFDWGYAHPWCFCWFAVNEDGDAFCVDTVRGRRQLPNAIAERILSRVPVDRLQYVHAGHDCWADVKARGEDVPTIAEQFQRHGIFLSRANISRKAGLNQLRDRLKWRGCGPGGTDETPGLRFMNTEGNRWLFEQLETIVTDPDDPEDARKVDADVDSGEGGDDGYDTLRYAMASRPRRGTSAWVDQPLDAWSKEVLEHEAREQRRSKRPRTGPQTIPDAVF